MRRLVIMLGLTILFVSVAAGVTVAKTKTCQNVPCRGTDKNDVLYERIGNHKKDRILGLRGDDDMSAALYTSDRDRLEGGRGHDRINVHDGDTRDAARGGRGRDVCLVDPGDSRSSCERVDTSAAGAESAGLGSAATTP